MQASLALVLCFSNLPSHILHSAPIRVIPLFDSPPNRAMLDGYISDIPKDLPGIVGINYVGNNRPAPF